MDKETVKQKENSRQADRRTDRQTGGKQNEQCAGRQIEESKQTVKTISKQTERLSQKNQLADRHACRNADKHIFFFMSRVGVLAHLVALVAPLQDSFYQ